MIKNPARCPVSCMLHPLQQSKRYKYISAVTVGCLLLCYSAARFFFWVAENTLGGTWQLGTRVPLFRISTHGKKFALLVL
jgi:hypothetical protein